MLIVTVCEIAFVEFSHSYMTAYITSPRMPRPAATSSFIFKNIWAGTNVFSLRLALIYFCRIVVYFVNICTLVGNIISKNY